MSKTFFKITTLFIALTAIILLSFTFISGRLFRNIITQKIYDKNADELNIIAESVRSMHETVKQFTFQMMEDPTFDTFLRNEVMNSSAGYNTMIDLAETIKINPYFHSVSLYSGYTEEFFSTLTSHSVEDDFVRDCVEHYRDVPVLSPVCRILPSEIYYTSPTVYSYFYYETGADNRITKAINVNMNAQWVCDYLNKLKGNGSKAYIIDRHNRTFIDGSSQIYNLDDTDLVFLRELADIDTLEKNYIKSELTDTQMITSLWMQNPDWILVITEQSSDFQNTIAAIRRNIIIIMSVLLLISCIASIMASNNIYRPWKELLQTFTTIPSKASSIRQRKLYDDVSAIHNSLNLANRQLMEYSSYKSSTEELLLETYIRSLLQEDTATQSRMSEKAIDSFHQALSHPMIIVLFRVDDWKHVKSALPMHMKGYFMHLSETMLPSGSGVQSVKWIYRGKDSGEFFMFAKQPAQPLSDDDWKNYICNLQKRFLEETGFTMSAALGGQAAGTDELVKAARHADALLQHSIMFQRSCTLDDKLVESHFDKDLKYDTALEKSLANAISSNKQEEALTKLRNILDLYRCQDRDTFTLYLSQLFLNLDKQLTVIDNVRGSEISALPKTMYYMLPEFKSLDDIMDAFTEKLQSLPQQTNSLENRHNSVVEAVKDYIQEHYSEEIVLKSIAADFNFSSGYLGNLFKENVGMSVLEYTNDVRLEAASQLIRSTNMNMIDILQKCGFINESTFYKQFKKKYGVTPTSYRTAMLTMRIKSEKE